MPPDLTVMGSFNTCRVQSMFLLFFLFVISSLSRDSVLNQVTHGGASLLMMVTLLSWPGERTGSIITKKTIESRLNTC